MNLKDVFAQRIATGLRRQSVTSPSRWAEQYRIMSGGPWSFKRYPWLREMHDCTASTVIGMKGAQLGFTELCLNLVLYKMDIHGTSCLYLLPSKTPDAAEFSSSRFDAALELSPHLQNLFSEVKNVSLKRAGKASLFIRGTQSKAGLRSLPVGLIILDERSAMNQENVPLALQRTKGQDEFQVFQISTPTIAGENIDWEYNRSSQGHFYFRCPGCSKYQTLTFPECLVITADDPNDPRVQDSYLQCPACKKVLPNNEKPDWLSDNEWVHDFPDRDVKGFHINQLYSPVKGASPGVIAHEFLLSRSDALREQEFFNGDLGLTHKVAGAQISDEMLSKAKANHRNEDPIPKNDKLVTMGIDVGSWCHFEICEWTFPKDFTIDAPETAHCKVIKQGHVRAFGELDSLINAYRPHQFVIDANPETRLSLALCLRYNGIGAMCYYGSRTSGKTITVKKDEPVITVHRTSWMDLALGRFHSGSIKIPLDTNLEYLDHLKAPVRMPKRDEDGNPTASYENGTKADHHSHSRTYAEIAMSLAMAGGTNGDLGKIV